MELCAICKKKTQKCTQKCLLVAPYLHKNKSKNYAYLAKVFGMKNVVRILNEIDPSQRQTCVDSLCYEAEARIRDPVYGCVGIIHHLMRIHQHLQISLKIARMELAMIEAGQNHQRSTYKITSLKTS